MAKKSNALAAAPQPDIIAYVSETKNHFSVSVQHQK
jgi:hypothetical protein